MLINNNTQELEEYQALEYIHLCNSKIFKNLSLTPISLLGPVAGPIVGFVLYVTLHTATTKAIQTFGKKLSEKLSIKVKKSKLEKFVKISKLITEYVGGNFAKDTKQLFTMASKPLDANKMQEIQDIIHKISCDENTRIKLESLMNELEENEVNIVKIAKTFKLSNPYAALDYMQTLCSLFLYKDTAVLLSRVTGLESKIDEIMSNYKQIYVSIENKLDLLINMNIKGFDIVTPEWIELRNSYTQEVLTIKDVYENRDIKRKILQKIENTIDYKNILITGEQGYGKTLILYRIIVDKLDEYVILLSNDEPIDFDSLCKYLDYMIHKGAKVLIAVDNIRVDIHTKLNIFKVIERYNINSVRFIVTMRSKDFEKIINAKTSINIENLNCSKIKNMIENIFKVYTIPKLDLDEVREFIIKYGKNYSNEIVRKYYEYSKGDPLILSILLNYNLRFEEYIHNIIESIYSHRNSKNKCKKTVSMLLTLMYICAFNVFDMPCSAIHTTKNKQNSDDVDTQIAELICLNLKKLPELKDEVSKIITTDIVKWSIRYMLGEHIIFRTGNGLTVRHGVVARKILATILENEYVDDRIYEECGYYINTKKIIKKLSRVIPKIIISRYL